MYGASLNDDCWMEASVPPRANDRLIDRMERTRIRWQKRFEATAVGKVWNRLSELGFVDSSLQFSAAFILSFIPFLLLVSAAIGRNLPHALVPGAASAQLHLTMSPRSSPTDGHHSQPSPSLE